MTETCVFCDVIRAVDHVLGSDTRYWRDRWMRCHLIAYGNDYAGKDYTEHERNVIAGTFFRMLSLASASSGDRRVSSFIAYAQRDVGEKPSVCRNVLEAMLGLLVDWSVNAHGLVLCCYHDQERIDDMSVSRSHMHVLSWPVLDRCVQDELDGMELDVETSSGMVSSVFVLS